MADTQVRDFEIAVRVHSTRPLLQRLVRRFAAVEVRTNAREDPGVRLQHGDAMRLTINFNSSPL